MFGVPNDDSDDAGARKARDTLEREEALAELRTPAPSQKKSETTADERPAKRARKAEPAAASAEPERIAPPERAVYRKTRGSHDKASGELFIAVYPNAHELGGQLGKLRVLVSDVELMFATDVECANNAHHDGLRIDALSADRVVFLRVWVPRRSFMKYENCSEVPVMRVFVKAQMLFDERANFTADCTLTLQRFLNGDAKEELMLTTFPAYAAMAYRQTMRRFTLPPIDAEQETFATLDDSKLHQYTVTMSLKELAKIVSQSRNRYDTLAFRLSDRYFEMTGHDSVSQTVSEHAVPYDETTASDLRKSMPDANWCAPPDDPLRLSPHDKRVFAALDAARARKESVCHLDRLPWAPDDIKRADIDNLRVAVRYLDHALGVAHASEYVEISLGRTTLNQSYFAPVRLRYRTLDANYERALIATTVYMSPKLDEA